MHSLAEEFPQWIAEARRGSRDALGKALEACRRQLLHLARQELDLRLQAKGGASDLVQDTFLDAQRGFAHFQGTSEEELIAWLRTLLHHRASHFGRHFRATQKRRLARETSLNAVTAASLLDGGPRADTPSPSVQMMANEQMQRLLQALDRLPADYRQVLTLRYVEQRSFPEIGEILQRTPNAARLLWLRAIEHVKQELRTEDES